MRQTDAVMLLLVRHPRYLESRYSLPLLSQYFKDTLLLCFFSDTDTVKTITKFYNTTLPSDMIFTKYDTSTSDEQVDKLTREFRIHYGACIGSLIYLLSTIVDLSFSVHKLTKFSEKPGKVHFEGLVHLMGYIMNNNTLGLKYYADMNDAPISDLLRQASINTENKLMAFSDSSWRVFQTLVEVQENIIYFIKMGKLTMAHMFQDQWRNKVHKVITI